MSKPTLQIGERVRVRMARKVEGIVHRVGQCSATVQVESDYGPLIISAPLANIETVNGDAPAAREV